MHYPLLECLFWLIRVEVMMHVGGLPAIHRSVVVFQTRLERSGPKRSSDVLCRAMEFACAFYPKRVLCLQRSAATLFLLRRYGWNAQLVIGAQTTPLKSHAWVELNGAVVGDKPYMREIYQVLERI